MSGRIAALVVTATLVSVSGVFAQDAGNATPGPGLVEVTYIPAGAAFFPSKGASATMASARRSTSISIDTSASRASSAR